MGSLRQFFQGGLGLDDRRTSWVYSLPPLVLTALCLGLLNTPNGDPKVQAYLLLGLALFSMMFCWRWAFKLSRSCTSTVDYVKGTTTSRMMVWFWAVFGGLALATQGAGMGVQVWLPLWGPSLYTFAGIGSILLTVGPAYKEYKEIVYINSWLTAPSRDVDRAMPTVHTKTRSTRALPSLAAALVLAAALPSWLLGRRVGRSQRDISDGS